MLYRLMIKTPDGNWELDSRGERFENTREAAIAAKARCQLTHDSFRVCWWVRPSDPPEFAPAHRWAPTNQIDFVEGLVRSTWNHLPGYPDDWEVPQTAATTTMEEPSLLRSVNLATDWAEAQPIDWSQIAIQLRAAFNDVNVLRDSLGLIRTSS